MKMKKVCAVMLALALCVAVFAGCGGASLSGKYSIVSMSQDGETYTAEMIEQNGISPESFNIEFKADGKCTISLPGDNEECTFKVKGKTLSVTDSDGEEITGTIDGKVITLSKDGMEMIFEKK